MMIAFYLLFLSTRLFSVEVFGHRGARSIYPENSIEALRYAARLGVTVEFDLQLTKDKEFIVFHDASLNRACEIRSNDDAFVKNLTLKEIQNLKCKYPKESNLNNHVFTIPTFYQAIAEIRKVNPNAHISFEVKYTVHKDEEFQYHSRETLVLQILKSIKGVSNHRNLTIQSFDFEILKNIRKKLDKYPEGPKLSYLYKGEYEYYPYCGYLCVYPNWPKIRKRMIDYSFDVFSPSFKLMSVFLYSSEFQELFIEQKNPFQIVTWTVNEQEQWAELLEMNIDGIMSDDPQRLKEFLKDQ